MTQAGCAFLDRRDHPVYRRCDAVFQDSVLGVAATAPGDEKERSKRVAALFIAELLMVLMMALQSLATDTLTLQVILRFFAQKVTRKSQKSLRPSRLGRNWQLDMVAAMSRISLFAEKHSSCKQLFATVP